MAFSFGEQLKEWRKAAGLSQQQMADAFEVKQQTVSDWERDASQPGNERLWRLTQVLNITPTQLLSALAGVSPDDVDRETRLMRRLEEAERILQEVRRQALEGLGDEGRQ